MVSTPFTQHLRPPVGIAQAGDFYSSLGTSVHPLMQFPRSLLGPRGISVHLGSFLDFSFGHVCAYDPQRTLGSSGRRAEGLQCLLSSRLATDWG